MKHIFATVLMSFSMFVIAPAAKASMTLDRVADALITGPNGENNYSGISIEAGIDCSASLSVRDGKFRGSFTYGDTGLSVEAPLTDVVETTTLNGVISVIIKDARSDINSTLNLTVKNSKVISMSVVDKDTILFIPRTKTYTCTNLEQFIPKP